MVTPDIERQAGTVQLQSPFFWNKYSAMKVLSILTEPAISCVEIVLELQDQMVSMETIFYLPQ